MSNELRARESQHCLDIADREHDTCQFQYRRPRGHPECLVEKSKIGGSTERERQPRRFFALVLFYPSAFGGEQYSRMTRIRSPFDVLNWRTEVAPPITSSLLFSKSKISCRAPSVCGINADTLQKTFWITATPNADPHTYCAKGIDSSYPSGMEPMGANFLNARGPAEVEHEWNSRGGTQARR